METDAVRWQFDVAWEGCEPRWEDCDTAFTEWLETRWASWQRGDDIDVTALEYIISDELVYDIDLRSMTQTRYQGAHKGRTRKLRRLD
jgi:hypothetical protein